MDYETTFNVDFKYNVKTCSSFNIFFLKIIKNERDKYVIMDEIIY